MFSRKWSCFSCQQVGPAEAVTDEDIAKGLVDEHVDYLRRRKLCMRLGRSKDMGLMWLSFNAINYP